MKKPWVIYGEIDGVAAKLRESSTRFGRAMRQAKEIKRQTRGDVFITQGDPAKLDGRHYTQETVSLETQQRQQQERNRQQLVRA